MIKFARVCDNSQKAFKEGNGKLKVQGLNFEIDYDVNKAIDVFINDTKIESAKLYKLASDKVTIDIDDVTNVTKAQRKDLKAGTILYANGKYNGLECLVSYNQDTKEFEIVLDIDLLLYS